LDNEENPRARCPQVQDQEVRLRAKVSGLLITLQAIASICYSPPLKIERQLVDDGVLLNAGKSQIDD